MELPDSKTFTGDNQEEEKVEETPDEKTHRFEIMFYFIYDLQTSVLND